MQVNAKTENARIATRNMAQNATTKTLTQSTIDVVQANALVPQRLINARANLRAKGRASVIRLGCATRVLACALTLSKKEQSVMTKTTKQLMTCATTLAVARERTCVLMSDV